MRFCTLLFLPFSVSVSLSVLVFDHGLVWDAGRASSQELSVWSVLFSEPATLHFICTSRICYCLDLPSFFFFFYFWGKVKFIVYFYIIFKLSEQILLKKKKRSSLYSQNRNGATRLWQVLADSVHVERPRRGNTTWGGVLLSLLFSFCGM